MNIQALSLSNPAPLSGASADQDKGFQQTLQAALSGEQSRLPAPMTQKEKARQIEAANTAAREEFLEYMKKPPMQRMREAILKQMGLTEADLAAMTPEQHAAVEAEIAERIRERLLEQAQEQLERTRQRVSGGA